MEPVRSLVLKGLMEGLALHAIEREPTHGYGILKQLEAALGERPSKNQVYPLLHQLEDDGYIESEPVEDARQKQIYHLTPDGEQRLGAYRGLPRPFKNWLAGLFGMPHLEDGPEPPAGDEPPTEAEAAEPEPELAPRPVAAASGQEAWVPELLAALPDDAEVTAPFASVSVDRHPAQGTWSLTVEHHEPGDHEEADRCSLTFLYLAMQQLLFQTRLDDG